ncbi:mediator complex subunit [Microbotryomycetes sp. JL201]|nr:mediator complex subunit [Microbotryomycetes sp. JL201]
MDAAMPQYSASHEQPPASAPMHVNGFAAAIGPFDLDAHTPAPPGKHSHALPVPQPPPASSLTPEFAQCERELPRAAAELVPLSFVVERIAAHAFAELANLTETLPHQDDATKKRAIVDYVLQTRRQVLKLLVLVRWSSQAQSVAKSMDIVGFLARQNFEFDNAVTSLTEIKSMLAGARVRNYDIPTALSVLTTGTYTRLPSAIKEGFLAPEKLNDQDVLDTLAQVDDVLRWRLACVESLPIQMRRYRIHDGRATFRVNNLWEADFTYGGDSGSETGQWYLLSLKFLFRVSDARGAWSDTPTGPMRQHIIELCNRELARRKPPDQASSMLVEPSATGTAMDRPFFRSFDFIQNLVLSYQLESMYSQAQRLAATQWSGTIQVELGSDRKLMSLRYWCPQRQDPPPGAKQPVLPASQSTSLLEISTSVIGGAASSKSACACENTLDQLLAGGQSDVADTVQVAWKPDLAAALEIDKVDLILGSDHDLETLLKRVTGAHARACLAYLYDIVAKEAPVLDLELVQVASAEDDDDTVPTMRINLYGEHFVLLTVSPMTGHVELKAVGEISAIRETRLRGASDKIDRERRSVAETLLRVRSSTILDDVDSRAAYLGFQTSRRMPLRSVDIARLNSVSRSFLFINLCPPLKPSSSAPPIVIPTGVDGTTIIQVGAPTTFYLVLVMVEKGFKFALVSVKEVSDQSQNWLGIEEVGWLDKDMIVSGKQSSGGTKATVYGFDVTLEELGALHQYCIQRLLCFKIEQGLSQRNIPYRSVAPSQGSTQRGPFLFCKSSDVLRNVHNVAQPNIAVQCFAGQDELRVSFHVKFKSLHLVQPLSDDALPSSIKYDAATSVVTFSFDNADEAVGLFVQAFAIIARKIVLARHRKGLEKEAEATQRKTAVKG